ncbi:hypothetical protein L218DRAFT_751010 [Marasmius fiardii PR-910]|nr:hypothetical protein L218DRAFT_751010 [Marasmius fiardii PR-910]
MHGDDELIRLVWDSRCSRRGLFPGRKRLSEICPFPRAHDFQLVSISMIDTQTALRNNIRAYKTPDGLLYKQKVTRVEVH